MAKNNSTSLWEGITENDFHNDANVDDINIAEYDVEKMRIFSANLNMFRQLTDIHGLKPVERRLLYAMYMMGVRPGTKTKKCLNIVGEVSKFHPHGEQSIYQTFVNSAQPWKKQVPLIHGEGNFGNTVDPDGAGAMRYIEGGLSEYAYDCFFDEYDKDCVEMIHNTLIDGDEPLALPSKYPNILVNGGMGIAIGNAYCIPPYNIPDIVKMTKLLIMNPDAVLPITAPYSPTGCNIVGDKDSLGKIQGTGTGTLKMRATIDIEESSNGKSWHLKIRNVPWLVSMKDIYDKLIEYTKTGQLPIKNIYDNCRPIKGSDGFVTVKIDYVIVLDKSQDPYQIRDKIYKLTTLERTFATNFKVVMSGFTIGKLSLRDLLLAWIDERREYKRRLINKKIAKTQARISILEILIYLLQADNINKTIDIIKNSTASEAINKLAKFGNMTSYQAKEVYSMRLSSFTKDKREEYKDEKKRLGIILEECLDIISHPSKIDEQISAEQNNLLKYDTGVKSKLISGETEKIIPETDHVIVVTKNGFIKKILYDRETGKIGAIGSVQKGDYPVKQLACNNLDNIVFIDSLGFSTCIDVYDIEATDPSIYGHRIYDLLKLDGNIVGLFHMSTDEIDNIMNGENKALYLYTVSKQGVLKKSSLEELKKMTRNKGIRICKLRSGDRLVDAGIATDCSNIVVFTAKGDCSYIIGSEIPDNSKDSLGSPSIKIKSDDRCAGFNGIGDNDKYLFVLTAKGFVKKTEIEYMQSPGKRTSSASMYVATVEPDDEVIYMSGLDDNQEVHVYTKNGVQVIKTEDIPLLARRSKCVKKIAVGLGSAITDVQIK